MLLFTIPGYLHHTILTPKLCDTRHNRFSTIFSESEKVIQYSTPHAQVSPGSEVTALKLRCGSILALWLEKEKECGTCGGKQDTVMCWKQRLSRQTAAGEELAVVSRVRREGQIECSPVVLVV